MTPLGDVGLLNKSSAKRSAIRTEPGSAQRLEFPLSTSELLPFNTCQFLYLIPKGIHGPLPITLTAKVLNTSEEIHPLLRYDLAHCEPKAYASFVRGGLGGG